MADGKDGEENFLMKALRIIATELPKFAKESNLPGTGGSDSENDSVMKPQSGANKEYSVTSGITELLPWIAPGVAAGSKLAAALLKRPVASSIAATAATGDPTNLIPGSAGLAVGMSGGVGDAEAVIVPASWTKDKSLLTQAIQMMQGGKRAEAIFDDTGIYAGPIDKKLRAVIPDYKAKLKNVPDDATDIRLGDILDHPDLFKVRPELARMIVNRQYVAGSNSKGAYSEGGLINPENIFLNTAKTNGPDDIMDTLLHEIQHAIQKRGDFERGAQVSKMLGHPKSGDVERELRDTIERNKNATKLLDRIGVRKTPEGWGIVEPGKEQEVPFLDLLANTLYSRVAGEAEARAVSRMKDLGAGEFPLNHYDEPLNKLIPSLNKKGGVSQVLDTKTFLGSFPEFSKTVLKDDKGDLIPLYHGTSKDKDFGSSFAKSKRGIFLSKDPNVANEYAKQNDSQDIVYEGGRFVHKNTASRVIPVYAKIENPYTLEGEEAKKYMYSSNYATAQRKIMEEAIAKGHDAVLYPDGAIVVADPRQIESAITTTTKAALAKRLKELGDKK